MNIRTHFITGDRHYDQKYQDMSNRLDNLYDRISELDEEIAGVDARIQAAYEKTDNRKKRVSISFGF